MKVVILYFQFCYFGIMSHNIFYYLKKLTRKPLPVCAKLKNIELRQASGSLQTPAFQDELIVRVVQLASQFLPEMKYLVRLKCV